MIFDSSNSGWWVYAVLGEGYRMDFFWGGISWKHVKTKAVEDTLSFFQSHVALPSSPSVMKLKKHLELGFCVWTIERATIGKPEFPWMCNNQTSQEHSYRSAACISELTSHDIVFGRRMQRRSKCSNRALSSTLSHQFNSHSPKMDVAATKMWE